MMLSQVIRSQEAFKKSLEKAAAEAKKRVKKVKKSSQVNEPPAEGSTKTVGLELTPELYKRLKALQTRRKLPSLRATCINAMEEGLRRAGL